MVAFRWRFIGDCDACIVRVLWITPQRPTCLCSDFRLLGLLNVVLRGRQFWDDDDPKRSIRVELRLLNEEFYATALERLV